MNATITGMDAVSKKQQLFREMLIGTLMYSVVLGFFNDYTDILHTRSYSTTFALAIVLQLLTYATLIIKKQVVKNSKLKSGKKGRALLIFGVWAVLFISKFVFLWVIGIIFRDSVQIEGFINIMLVVLTMLIIQKIIESIDNSLSNPSQQDST